MNNCCTSDIPRIVRGNDWTARVRVLRAVVKDCLSKREDIDLEASTDVEVNLVTRLGRKIAMPFTISGGRLLVDFGKDIPSGLYGLEVTGKDSEGKNWRSFLKPMEFVEIVEATSEATGLNVSGTLNVVVDVAPSTISAELLNKINAAVDDAEKAAQNAASQSSIKFVDNYDSLTEAPAEEGNLAMSGDKLYESVKEDDKLIWQETTAKHGNIYIDSATAQSYVADKEGNLVRLDKESQDLLFDVETE